MSDSLPDIINCLYDNSTQIYSSATKLLLWDIKRQLKLPKAINSCNKNIHCISCC